MQVRMRIAVYVALVAVLALAPRASAQAGFSFSGRLIDTLSGEAIPKATVVLEELRQETTSGPDGIFTFANVPAGEYHVVVRAPGYSQRRTEVTVPSAAAVDVLVNPELHYQEVVSVSPEGRSQLEAFQATSVLAGQELTKQLEMSLGETLQHQPGVASRSFGSAPSRPVIRGLDGDRVLILQDGQRVGDLSSQSGDHGVTINPAGARRIEVVRGPATLLYGANAIGGLVNVITDEIPTTPEHGVSGTATLDLGSASREAAAAGDIHAGNGTVAVHVGGGGRRAGNTRTPLGTVENSQARGGFGNVGLSLTRENGYLGGSYGYDDTRYGIPVVDDGQLELTPRRHALSVRAGAQNLTGVFEAFRTTLAHRRYRHDELHAGEVETEFRNTTTELEVMGSHRPLGRLRGSIGGWVLDRGFDAVGEEALSPAVDQRGFAAFLYEEIAWPHFTFQFGGRLDHVRFAPFGEAGREFTDPSASVGLLFRPAAADESLTIAVSVARAVRNPALEELFFFGEHHGNFAFEVGNPALVSEKAFGVDVSLRWSAPRASGEVTYFRNDVRDFIFRNPLTEDEFEEREEEFEERFAGRTFVHDGHGHGDEEAELRFVEFVGADSLLQGVEAHADLQVTARVLVELGLDYVRGSLRAGGGPLPRMPPLRLRGGIRYQYSALQVGGEVVGAAAQNRVAVAEDPTSRYGLLRLFAAYSFVSGGAVNTITARLDNATDTLYRNHLSLIKELVPERGRNVKLLYSVGF